MTFLNGALLWFGLGGLIPIVIHLLHRQRYQRVRWAAMEFLLRAMRKTQRRIRLENLILLLIRIAAMLLLAMAIAEPVLKSTALGGHALTHCFVVVDNSYSMGYQPGQTPLLKQAKELAKKLVIDEELAAFSQDDRISVVTLSDFPQNLTGSGINDKQKAKEVIESIELSDYGTSMLQTARLLTRLLEDPQWAQHRKKIFIVTDLQRSGWAPPGAEAQAELAAHLKALSGRPDTRVVLADVSAAAPRNTAAVGLKMLDPVAIAGRPVALAAELHNFSDEELPNAAVTLWAGLDDGKLEEKATQTVFLPAGGSATAHFRHTFVAPGQARLKVELQSDRLNSAQGVDNARFLALEVREEIRILCVDGEAGEGARKDETYYFARALNPNFGREFRVTAKLDTFFDGSELEHDEVDVLVLANIAGLRPEVVARVEAYVARGGGLLISLGGAVDLPSYNEHLWKEGKGLLPASLKSIEGGGEGAAEFHLGAVDAAHPVFDGFVEIMMTALRKGIFQRFIRTEGHDPRGMAAAFDDAEGSPALLEKRFGEGPQAGRVLLFTSTLDHDWADGFPGNNIYLVLVHELVKHLASRPADERNLFVGDTIVHHLPARRFGDFSIQLPSGPAPEPSRSDLKPGDAGFQIYYPGRPAPPGPGPAANEPKGAAVNEGLSQAGFYLLMRHGGADSPGTEVLASFAANVPPRFPSPEAIQAAEGNLERLALNPDEAAPLPDFPDFRAAVVSPERGGRPTAEARVENSGAWRLLVWILLGLLALESLLAMLFGRRKA